MVQSNDVEDGKGVFEEITKHRTFKITVEGKTFFVNPSFLAERSAFFETLLFGDFKEKREGKAELKDVKAEDFEQFLLVLGADAQKRRRIHEFNFVVLANFSHMWVVNILREECIMFIDSDFALLGIDVKTAVDIAAACETLKVPTVTQRTIAAKLGQYSYDDLKSNNAQLLVGSVVATAAFLAANAPQNCVCGLSDQGEASECCFSGCVRGFLRGSTLMSTSGSPFSSLNKDCFLLIALHIGPDSRRILAQTCRRFRNLIKGSDNPDMSTRASIKLTAHLCSQTINTVNIELRSFCWHFSRKRLRFLNLFICHPTGANLVNNFISRLPLVNLPTTSAEPVNIYHNGRMNNPIVIASRTDLEEVLGEMYRFIDPLFVLDVANPAWTQDLVAFYDCVATRLPDCSQEVTVRFPMESVDMEDVLRPFVNNWTANLLIYFDEEDGPYGSDHIQFVRDALDILIESAEAALEIEVVDEDDDSTAFKLAIGKNIEEKKILIECIN